MACAETSRLVIDVIHLPGADIEVMRTPDVPLKLVLLPELFGGVRGYRSLVQALSDEELALGALNPRGCGASSGSVDGATMDVLLEDVVGVIEAVTSAPVFVAGHAFGNRLARLLATRRPDLVAGLILLSAGGVVKGSAGAYKNLWLAAQEFTGERARLRNWNKFMLANPRSVPPELANWNDRSHLLARKLMGAGSHVPVEEWWGGGDAPMLVIQGGKDRIAPPENGQVLKSAWPGRVQLATLLQAAHGVPFEEPAKVAKLIADWIHAIEGKAGSPAAEQ